MYKANSRPNVMAAQDLVSSSVLTIMTGKSVGKKMIKKRMEVFERRCDM